MRLITLLLLLLISSLTHAIQYFNCPNNPLEPVVLKGKRFFDSNGNYFPIKGIAYYPRPNDGELQYSNSVDLFTDQYRALWEQDVANFVRLGVNVIRIYAVDPSQSHDAFMCALQEAGIYVIVGLLADCGEDCSIGIAPAPACYPERLKNRGQWIINVFSKYTNTLAFSAGNEATIFAEQVADNAPCQKKFLRDMRAFMHKCRQVPRSILPRDIPIGMVNWDYEREAQTLYFHCRTNTSDVFEETEWYGLNTYRHCNPDHVSIDQLTGWQNLRDDFAAYSLPTPVVIAEFGCRGRFPAVGQFAAQRNWLQMDALYNEQYSEVFAGGVVFEYSAEKRQADGSRQQTPWPYRTFTEYQFGVGYFTPINCDHTNIFCQYIPYPEFDLLAAKMDSIDVSFAPSMNDYFAPATALPQCPTAYSPLSDFSWPSDTSPDEWCYIVGSEAPTKSPSSILVSTTIAPSLSPASKAPTPVQSANPTALPIRTTMETIPTALPILPASMEPTADGADSSNVADGTNNAISGSVVFGVGVWSASSGIIYWLLLFTSNY